MVLPASAAPALTLAEKLLSRAAGETARAGEFLVCDVDQAMGTDASVPMALDYFSAMQPEAGLPAPARADALAFAFDHYGAGSGPRALALQEQARAYAQVHGVHVFEVGEGIGHQRMMESGRVLPGRLVVAADSHAVSYGALNAFGTGIGSSDLAGVLQCHQVWLRVPATLRVDLVGSLSAGVSAKDAALVLIGQLGADGASAMALEFGGDGLRALDMDDRIVLANMSVEAGAKAGLFPCDAVTRDWLTAHGAGLGEPLAADADCEYAGRITFDLGAVGPQLALPHQVDNVVDPAGLSPLDVHIVYLGTCTGGRVKDFHEALDVLRGGRLAPGVQLIVAPASAAVAAALEADGSMAAFRDLGADIRQPGCAGCCGTCGPAPADGSRVVSTANRNFLGRMGNRASEIVLGSPRTCAEAALRGQVGMKPDEAAR